MECGEHDGRCAGMARAASGVVLQLHVGLGGGAVPVAVGARLPGGAPRAAGGRRAAAAPGAPTANLAPPPAPHAADAPFINDMDEISYWIYTKRAPCLMNYDKLVRKQSQQAQCSTTVPEEPPSPRKKKKKRKLSLLDEDSVATEKPQNVFFEMPPKRNISPPKTLKTESAGSDVDFNLTTTKVAQKNKKPRLKKSTREKLHKKAKLVTSTPKAPVALRRSLRHTRQTGDNSCLDRSIEVYNTSVVSNGHFKHVKEDKMNKSTQIFASRNCDAGPDNKRCTSAKNHKSKTMIQPNGQFEDLSDVSGFTANYIRSTKVQSSKTPSKLLCKASRSLRRESGRRAGDTAVCLNKATNTGLPAGALDCSTDSSQNVIHLVSTRSQDKPAQLDRTTSPLKFVDASCEPGRRPDDKRKSKSNLNVSFQSQSSSASRYPKRYKNPVEAAPEARVCTRASRRLQRDGDDKKESSGLALRERGLRPRRAAADSTRERSGFAACFSDSDDSAPLLQRKYFCN